MTQIVQLKTGYVPPKPERSQEELEREELRQKALQLMKGDRFDTALKLIVDLYNFTRATSGMEPV